MLGDCRTVAPVWEAKPNIGRRLLAETETDTNQKLSHICVLYTLLPPPLPPIIHTGNISWPRRRRGWQWWPALGSLHSPLSWLYLPLYRPPHRIPTPIHTKATAQTIWGIKSVLYPDVKLQILINVKLLTMLTKMNLLSPVFNLITPYCQYCQEAYMMNCWVQVVQIQNEKANVTITITLTIFLSKLDASTNIVILILQPMDRQLFSW